MDQELYKPAQNRSILPSNSNRVEYFPVLHLDELYFSCEDSVVLLLSKNFFNIFKCIIKPCNNCPTEGEDFSKLPGRQFLLQVVHLVYPYALLLQKDRHSKYFMVFFKDQSTRKKFYVKIMYSENS
jgi:hypothetical protein